jgi:Flp pilus assembly protein TadG
MTAGSAKPTKAGSLLREERGVSAIEFALIAPVMLVLYVGAVEIGNALTIDRRVSLVASTAADLVAQKKTTSNAELKDVANVATGILTPYTTKPLKIVLTSVVADQNNKGKVAWSYASTGGGARPKNSAYTVPEGLTQANTSRGELRFLAAAQSVRRPAQSRLLQDEPDLLCAPAQDPDRRQERLIADKKNVDGRDMPGHDGLWG